MKTKHYFLIAILSYVFFTLATTPAAAVFSLAQKNIKLPFTLQGIDGTIWNGSAERLNIPNSPQVNNINWCLNPLALLIARVSSSVEASILDNQLTGNVSINSSGDISASNIKTRMKAEAIQKLINLPMGEISGDFIINIDSLESRKALPMAHGTIQWNKARFTLADTVSLGNVNILIKPSDNNGLNIILNNKDGDLDIAGQIHLEENKNFKLNLNFKPLPNTQNNIKQSLAMFAKRQTNGTYLLKQNGNLRSLGL